MEISGFILDQNTTYPLAGASVVIQGKGIGTATDSGGHYYFNDSRIGPQDNVLVTYVGYIPATVPVDFIARQNAIGEDVATSLQTAPPQTLPGVIVTTTAPPSQGSFTWLWYIAGGLLLYKFLKKK